MSYIRRKQLVRSLFEPYFHTQTRFCVNVVYSKDIVKTGDFKKPVRLKYETGSYDIKKFSSPWADIAYESIRFFRLKFLVSPAEKFFSAGETRNLSRNLWMLSQAKG